MRVRVYDGERDQCFLSEMYAILGEGIFVRCLVAVEGQLRLYHQFLPDENGVYHTMVSMVDPDVPAEWVHLEGFQGYPWVCEDRRTFQRLLAGEAIPLADTKYPTVSSLLSGWRYVTDAAGADAFLEETGWLHDAVLVEAGYISGSRKDSDGGMLVCDRVRQVRLLFHLYETPPLELLFEGVKAFHLYPGGNNQVSALSEAVCRVINAIVFFSDGYCEPGDEADYQGTCVWAYSLRWRFLSEEA